jgi:hypothetical protein
MASKVTITLNGKVHQKRLAEVLQFSILLILGGR